MTLFNPIDPNNSAAAFRFLSKNQLPSEMEELGNQSNLSISGMIVGEIQDELFDETWKIRISKVSIPFKNKELEEGQDIQQVVSLLNDVNMKQVNIKRRNKNPLHVRVASTYNTWQQPLPSPGHVMRDPDLLIREELQIHQRAGNMRKSVLNPTNQTLTMAQNASIGMQQQRVVSPQREKKALAVAKILEQAQIKEKPGQAKKKKKAAKKAANTTRDQAIGMSDSDVSVQEEMQQNKYAFKGVNAAANARMMMSSSQSIAYLQTLQEAERNNPMLAAHRDSASRRSATTLSYRKLKVYKPTPSMRQLHPNLWTVDENQHIDEMVERATYDKIISDESDEEDDDYGDEEDLPSKDDSVVSEKQLNADGFFHQDEVMVTTNKVQCIVQGGKTQQQRSINIKKGDILEVEVDLPDLNLVQCKAYYEGKWLSIVVPRDSLTKDFAQVVNSSDESSNESNQDEMMMMKPQVTRMSSPPQHGRGVSNPQNPSPYTVPTTPVQLSATPASTAAVTPSMSSKVGAGMLLKLKSRRDKKQLKDDTTAAANEDHEQSIISGNLSPQNRRGAGQLLKVMERKLNKMMVRESPHAQFK